MAFLFLIVLLSVLATTSNANIPNELWDYVEVRQDANMFWWLYGASAASEREHLPLVMWLQGGPGASSTGFGNFEELGPLDVDLRPRPYTWVKVANVLFVDNPVGSGFSYVTRDSAYTTNVLQIADDLVTAMKGILKRLPVLEKCPFYVFCESYGGKMVAAFGVALQKAIATGDVKIDFKGVALGDSWISPIDYVSSWGPYLHTLSLINDQQLQELRNIAEATAQALQEKEFTKATKLWGEAEDFVTMFTDGVSFYNVLLHNGDSKTLNFTSPDMVTLASKAGLSARWIARHLHPLQSDSLSALMNGPIREKLGIIPKNVTWGGQSGAVFSYQSGDFMKDVITDVDTLLESGLTVVVYSGQLDLICATTGTLAWMRKLTWSGLEEFQKAKKTPLYAPSGLATRNTGAFIQQYKNLHFYYVLDAGHMVPKDNGEMALDMLSRIIH